MPQLVSTPNRDKTASSAANDKRTLSSEESLMTKDSTSPTNIQTKLMVGSADDPLEHEADAVAESVMRMPENSFIQRKCDECEKEDKLQKKPLAGNTSAVEQANGDSQAVASDSTASAIHASSGKGNTLDQRTNSFMSTRFGNDFSGVRIHTDSEAVQLNRNLKAKAFTTGTDIYFNEGQFQPTASEGKKLLAHELTHVVQQKAGAHRSLQRQMLSDQPPEFVDQRDGAPHAATCGGPSSCPKTFCEPYKSENLARSQRDKMMWILLGGIAAFVNTRVVPLWSEYLMGGSAPQNLTGKFGADFAASPTTVTTTSFLIHALKRNLTASRPSFPSGVNVTTVDLKSTIGAEIAAINKAGGVNEMDFNYPSDIAGNLAGGIGDNQTACKSGAQPSPFNDERLASGFATVIKDSSDNLIVYPFINYTVKDTIDLCPGNCGTSKEQIATVPMSQFEATGISGDVPFTIDFSSSPPPFTIAHP
jgi:hypothetical protein